MATKSYSKHKEYKEFSSSTKGSIPPYTDEQFDMIKSELLPKGSKLDSIGRNGVGAREYHYEYKEEKHPSGKYDRKDLRTVEEYTIPPKTVPKESSAYYYEREERELPALTGTRTYNYETTSSTPGYSKVKSSKVTKEMSQNVEELDSLLDDLQRDQERQLYKSGYASDTAESTSFDYKKGTPVKAPSSGYSTLKREERLESSSWGSPAPPPVARQAELRQEIYREEKTESRVVPSQVSPALPLPVPTPVCAHCHQPPTVGTLSRSGTPMNKVTTTVKTYTYEVPAGQDPTAVPIPVTAEHSATYTSEEHVKNNTCVTGGGAPGGCQHCPHCNSRLRDYRSTTLRSDEHTSERTNERMLYPAPANETKLLPENGHPSYGPTGTSYKYSETSYSSQNTAQRFPSSPSPAPFPRPHTPSTQQPPKKLDDLLADFPEAKFPTSEGLVQRKVETRVEGTEGGRRAVHSTGSSPGPAVYYPPGHTPFQKKDPEPAAYQSSAMVAGGGAYASGRGAYEYEAGAKSKEKHSEKKTAVPVCLPLCCAMPCVIM
ncbi:uncharacterized protein LOC121736424 [Aricia agestis]|uniref:uncharacterized protein LOC121736424 n=1 Tax=Aricia agestis TaxID=91739 RepID=UPI001C20C201|nr:uncharacterized protein LOC121736424 [Aricia agestis]